MHKSIFTIIYDLYPNFDQFSDFTAIETKKSNFTCLRC